MRRLFQCGYPEVQRLLEDDAYLKPVLIRGNTVIHLGELSSAHQLVKKLFCNLKIPPVPLAGRLVDLLGSWEKLTKERIFCRYSRISNSTPSRTETKRETNGNKLFNAREGNNLVRSGKPLEQGCCGTSLSSSEQYNYSEKEGWGQQTCDQFEGVKPIYYFPTFQKGEFTFAENCLAKKRVYVQTRSQRRIFMCPTFSEQPKESEGTLF